jgi:Domain of unknown function (DUF4160)
MPTIIRIGPYRFAFYSKENNEPPHIHVKRDRCSAKFWLEPVKLATNGGFAAHELNVVRKLVQANQQRLTKAWNGHFQQQKKGS